jgi:hypothetical protein
MHCIYEMSTHGVLDQASPPGRFRDGFIERAGRQGVDQGIVPEQQLWTAPPLADGPPRKELQPAREKSGLQQPEIVGKGRRVAGILQLSEHFVIRENLSRERRRQREQMSQKRRLGDFLQLEHVPRQDRFDQ